MAANVFTKIPNFDLPSKSGQLNSEQIKQYFEQGWLLLEDFIPLELLNNCRTEIGELVDGVAKKLFEGGKIKSLHENCDFFQRLTKIEEDFPGANILLHKSGILPEAVQKVWTYEPLLNVMEQLIGPDIAGHPVWNIRTKTPQNEAATVPWHQDNAYLDTSVDNIHIPTGWIPLLDADEKNGCLEFIEEGHRTGKLAKHVGCHGETWYIEVDLETIAKELEIDVATKQKMISVRYGSILLFNNVIPHRSLDNFSDKIRWSLDLRWVSPYVSNGFHNLKNSVTFKEKGKTLECIDWDHFNAVDRTLAAAGKDEEQDPFDTTISGPWMGRWELVNHNRHTRSYQAGKSNYHKN